MEALDLYNGSFYTATKHEFSSEKPQKTVENFAVEDLLVFPSEDAVNKTPIEYSYNGSSIVTDNRYSSSSISGGANLLLLHHNLSDDGEIFNPYDDLAQIEWHLKDTENSFSTEELQNLHLITGRSLTPESSSSVTRPTNLNPNSLFTSETSLPPKAARSKRSRPNHFWSTPLFRTPKSEDVHAFTRPAKTTPSKRRESASDSVMARKCLHCATEKTPQWRSGPMGPKTLCNACGVRYKSGRLVPEYRPAASPTFVSTKHSNSHRKVMELRRQQELGKQKLQQQHSYVLGQCSNYGMPNCEGDEFLNHQHAGNDYKHVI